MKKLALLLTALIIMINTLAQSDDERNIRKIFDEALARGQSYKMLEQLTKQVGPRLSGSPGAAAAV